MPMSNSTKNRSVAVTPERGALTYLVITYLATLAVASVTITLLCRSISG